MIRTDKYEALKNFEPKGFLTDIGYIGYLPGGDKDRGILFDTEQEYLNWIKGLKIAFLGETGE